MKGSYKMKKSEILKRLAEIKGAVDSIDIDYIGTRGQNETYAEQEAAVGMIVELINDITYQAPKMRKKEKVI
jgi:hypothetical protein